MRILLTGATGFVGRHVFASLAGEHELSVVGRTAPQGDHRWVDWVEADLSAPLDVARLPRRVDAVVHLAHSRRYREFPRGTDDVFAVNVRSTLELIEYARSVDATRFVYTSSGGVYREGPDVHAEDDPIGPLTFYQASKAAAENLIAPYASELTTIVLRPFFVYGPGQGPESPWLVSSLADRVLRGEPISILGNPGLRINPLFVDDAVQVVQRALEHDASVVCNAAGDDVVNMTELVETLGTIAERDPVVSYDEADRSGGLVGDNRRMKSTLGVQLRVPLHAGLEQVVTALQRQTAGSRG